MAYMVNIFVKVGFFQVETKNFFIETVVQIMVPSERFRRQQIEQDPNIWQYPIKNYPVVNAFMCYKLIFWNFYLNLLF